MAKGRKLTTSRSERLLGTAYSYGQTHYTQGSTAALSAELGEEDVWPMVDNVAEREDLVENISYGAWNTRSTVEFNGGGSSMRSRRLIPREDGQVGGLSLAFDDSGRTTSPRILHQFRGHEDVASPRGHNMATSAPVNVPDWSRILRVDSVDSLQEFDDGLDDDDDSEVVPPHEYLARSRKLAATSVFEGVGRTLKGRDLRRVRDAVWSQTGFDG